MAHRPVAIVLAPSRLAISGVTTHLNLLLGSALAQDFALIHFQVGSEGRDETAVARLWRLLWSPLLLALRILLAKADVVHINTSLNRRAWWRDLAYLLAAKACGARVVYQVHGGDLPRRFAAVARVPAALLRLALGLPDAVVVLARSELTAYRDFIPHQNVSVFPNGIDVGGERPRMRLARLPSAPLQILYVGRLAPGKGLAETVEGLALARRQHVPALLTVAGSGSDEAALRQLADRLGVADAVRFVGPVFDGEKQRLFAVADVLALPSHAEGMPYMLLEGMAAGLPAIVTPVGGIPDVVEDGVHGVVVPVGDGAAIGRAIVRLAHDRRGLAAMSIASRRRIQRHHSIERLAGDLACLYRSLCGAAPHSDA